MESTSTSTSLMIRDYPEDQRPRERLIQDGPKSLSNHELLAIMLRTGFKDESVVQLANKLLTTFEGLRLLKDASVDEITNIKGIGSAKAVQILAAVELGRRIHRLQYEDRYVIRSPEDAANYVMEDMRFLSQEHFVCLYLHQQTIFIGSLNASIVHPREVFKEAFRRSAASFICLHNHRRKDMFLFY
jgi:DNA repair protein RadC